MNGSGKKNILIIDKDPGTRSFLEGLLSDLYSVTFITEGRSAIKKVEAENSADVAVVDYRLPDISGLVVLKEIKRIRPHLPVIFITAYGDEEVAVKAFLYGAKDYLKKPLNYHELLHTIQFNLSLTSLDKRAPRRVLTAELDPVDYCEERTGNGSVTKYNLQKALTYINNNFMTKISLDTVAKTACTSKYHLSREFKKSLGCTYQEYLKKLRLEKARALLKNTNLSVTETAFFVGYADLTNFERIFKKITGCTPRQYKNARTPG